MAKKYPLTYEEYEQKIIQLYLKNKQNKEEAMNRLNTLLQKEPQLIEELYEETCFRYDSPQIYGETCKKVFEEYLLESIPVHTLNLLI